jgi:lysyl endopeptidase
MFAAFLIQASLSFLFLMPLQAQQTFSGGPYSSKLNTENPNKRNYVALSPTVATLVLPAYTNEYLIHYTDSVARLTGDYADGKCFKMQFDIIRDGTCQRIKGMNIYRIRVKSKHAKALQFYFDQFFIPRGGKLFLFRFDGTRSYGALNYKNNPTKVVDGIQMSTPPLPGNDWIIEYNIPARKDQGKLVVGIVCHVFR